MAISGSMSLFERARKRTWKGDDMVTNAFKIVALTLVLSTGLFSQRHFRHLDISLKGDAEFILSDSLGRKTGHDPLSKTDFFEIPGATFASEGVDSESPEYEGIASTELTFNNPFSGTYVLKVIGATSGTYDLIISLTRSVKINKQEYNSGRSFRFQENTVRGSVFEYQIYYDSDTTKEVSSTPIFSPLAFLDTLISYKHQAYARGGIKEEGVVTSLDSKLEAARPAIINDRPSAKQILQSFILELDGLITQSDQITHEAFILLKENAQFLISKL